MVNIDDLINPSKSMPAPALAVAGAPALSMEQKA